jgi:hypothetical protein
MARWRYPARDRDWQACERCHGAIQAGDREALLTRGLRMPVPRSVPDRYAPQFHERTRGLNKAFWSGRRGAPSGSETRSKSKRMTGQPPAPNDAGPCSLDDS